MPTDFSTGKIWAIVEQDYFRASQLLLLEHRLLLLTI